MISECYSPSLPGKGNFCHFYLPTMSLIRDKKPAKIPKQADRPFKGTSGDLRAVVQLSWVSPTNRWQCFFTLSFTEPYLSLQIKRNVSSLGRPLPSAHLAERM